MYTNRSSADTHATWQPVTQSTRSRRSYGKMEDCEQCSLKINKGLALGFTSRCTSTSSWEVRVECEPMTNKVGVFSSKRGSSTPCQKWTMLISSIFVFFLVQSKQTVRSLRRYDSNGGENWAFFEPWCDYPNTLYLSNVRKLSLSWSLEKNVQVQKENEKIVFVCSRSQYNVK